MSSIGSYTVSPFINNRINYSACGIGSVDSLEQFCVSTYTSGDVNSVGLSVQATHTPPLSSASPIDVTRSTLWTDALTTTNCPFTIDSAQTLTLQSQTNDIQLKGTLSSIDTVGLTSVSITPSFVLVANEQNLPFGDPIYSNIAPNSISMQNGNGSNQTLTMNSTLISLTSDIVSNTLNIDAASISATNNLTLLSSGLGNINLNAQNINSYSYSMPICFTGSKLADNFNYSLGGQQFENVYNLSYGIPYQFISDSPQVGYTSNIWKIEFALNCYDCLTTGDRGVALYIQFQDQNSNIYIPVTYNLDTPYAVWQNSAQYSGTHLNFQNFNWTDYVDFSSMVGTGSGNVPLTVSLYWAGDSVTSNKFNLTITLTRTNVI